MIYSMVCMALLWGSSPKWQAHFQVTPQNNHVQAKLVMTLPAAKRDSWRMQLTAGHVRIKTWDQPNIQVEEHLIWRDDAQSGRQWLQTLADDYFQTRSQAGIKRERSHTSQWQHHLTISLPPQLKVVLRNGGGDLHIEGRRQALDLDILGGEVVIQDQDGDVDFTIQGGFIRFQRVTGKIRIDSQGTPILFENCSGPAKISTNGGSIECIDTAGKWKIQSYGGNFKSTRHRGHLDVFTSAGNLEIVQLRGTIKAGTQAGHIALDMLPDTATKGQIVELYTQDGNIQAALPKSLVAQIRAEIWLVGQDYNLKRKIESDFHLRIRDRHMEEQRRLISGDGRFDRGKSKVFVKTYSGDIRLNALSP